MVKDVLCPHELSTTCKQCCGQCEYVSTGLSKNTAVAEVFERDHEAISDWFWPLLRWMFILLLSHEQNCRTSQWRHESCCRQTSSWNFRGWPCRNCFKSFVSKKYFLKATASSAFSAVARLRTFSGPTFVNHYNTRPSTRICRSKSC